ncbi:MFS transporter [Streptomyces sp. NBC_00094]|uniref:MFS transporter n=1 Tax=Streptomyces sp. NBC_00094 TaxID=2903620 RepID=UPI0022544933|nr:MFS transporter [Streptomyces sp. NBC_00094]MCX5395094.1 MFS transporter [Streptomyces sp. NBC_00094]
MNVLLTGTFVSSLGDKSAALAFALYAASMGSTALMAAILLAQLLPSLVLGLIGGYLTDRYGNPLWWSAALVVQALCFAALSQVDTVWPIVSLIAASSAAQSIVGPMGSVLLRELSPVERRGRSVRRRTSLDGMAGVIGLMLAGLSYSWLNRSTLLLVNSASFLVLVLCSLVALRGSVRRPRFRGSARARPERWTGFGVLLRPEVFGRQGVFLIFVVILGTSLEGVVGIFYLQHGLGLGNTWYSVAIASWSLGLLLGSLRVPVDRASDAGGRLLGASACVMGAVIAAPTLLPLTGGSVALAFLIGGAANGAFNASVAVVIAERASSETQGRAWAAFAFLAKLAILLGYASGAAAGMDHARALMFAAGAVPVLIGLGHVLTRSRPAPAQTPEVSVREGSST